MNKDIFLADYKDALVSGDLTTSFNSLIAKYGFSSISDMVDFADVVGDFPHRNDEESSERQQSYAKSIFDSPKEKEVYIHLVTLHPTKLVLPNQALSSFINYEDISKHLAKDEIDYFFKSRVDFLLVHPFNLYPLLAVEVQSYHHEKLDVMLKDSVKSKILEVAGVPLKLINKTGDVYE